MGIQWIPGWPGAARVAPQGAAVGFRKLGMNPCESWGSGSCLRELRWVPGAGDESSGLLGAGWFRRLGINTGVSVWGFWSD